MFEAHASPRLPMLIATRERANARCLATKAHGPDVKDTKKMRWTLNPNNGMRGMSNIQFATSSLF